MSYILEALKKSEQERGHGSTPGIQTVHSSSLNYQASKRSTWPWILIAVLALNLVALVYFVFHDQQSAPEETALTHNEHVVSDSIQLEPATPEPPAAEAMPSPETTLGMPPAPAQPAAPQQADQQRATRSSPQNVSMPVAMQAVDIMQLPDNIRRQIPQMEFSAHVYSSNPVQRSVVINNRFMEEGESMNHDFVLREITSTGVIMDFRGYLFHTSVITGWDVQ